MRTKLERVIAQIVRAVPLKVRACEGTSEGSLAEVYMLEHALCRSNLSPEKINPCGYNTSNWRKFCTRSVERRWCSAAWR